MLNPTQAWKTAYPDAHVGILIMQGVENPPAHAALDELKHSLETELRERFAGQDRKALESIAPVAAYAAYYKLFKKSYPVQAQLESIVLKGKSIPSVAALVEAMFMAEVKNLLLTAGHDFDKLQLPVKLSVADGTETYTLLRGQAQALKAGDMCMADQAGVVSSVIYGPDQRTQINAGTRAVLFAVYAPAGVERSAVQAHLEDIRDYALVVAPGAAVQTLQILGSETK